MKFVEWLVYVKFEGALPDGIMGELKRVGPQTIVLLLPPKSYHFLAQTVYPKAIHFGGFGFNYYIRSELAFGSAVNSLGFPNLTMGFEELKHLD